MAAEELSRNFIEHYKENIRYLCIFSLWPPRACFHHFSVKSIKRMPRTRKLVMKHRMDILSLSVIAVALYMAYTSNTFFLAKREVCLFYEKRE